MISVGSRDGKKGLSLRYGVEGGDMDLETELEEGEACFQNNNDDDSTIDPDVALSYLDEKLQDVLGHFQKDFEGGVSAENLGAKFGGYGSFLPTYQRSPACPHPKTPPKVPTNNASIFLNDFHIEGGGQNSVSVNASQPTRHGPGSTSSASVATSMNCKVKQEVHTSSARPAEKFNPDQKSLKVRIKVGSDNLSTRKNAEIYSGLGLDVSPSSSFEASPLDSDEFCHHESLSSILETMTSFPVLGGLLLSPLPNDLLYLTKKEKNEDNKSDSKAGRNIFCEKKPKSEDNFGCVTKKETEMVNMSCEELVSNALRLPLLSDTQGDILNFRKGAISKPGSSVVPKEESLDPVSTHDELRVEKPYRKDGAVGNANSDEKYPGFSTKSDAHVLIEGGKIIGTGLIKPPKQKAAKKATSLEKHGIKLLTPSSSGGKKKSKVSQSLENDFQSVGVSKAAIKTDSSYKSRNNVGKVRETYKDFFGELEDVDDMALEEKPFGDRSKDHGVDEKVTLESSFSSKERLNGKKGPKPSSLAYPGPNVSDAVSATVAAVVKEDWVGCDKCQKWRLLPPGVNPASLPDKWLCSMLDWLPGMNRCSISQEETTKAMTSHFPGPATTIQGLQPGGSQSVDPPHLDQRHQPFGPPSGVKKKHGTKDLPNEPKQERPSLSSNSTKKNFQISNKTRSLNGANQSPLINEVEFQDSGQSSSLIAENHRLKHKEKKKLHESFVDEGNNALQLKIRNKRETSQDYSRDFKKVKTEDLASDYDGAVFKTINSSVSDLPKESKSGTKGLGINPKNHNENETYHMGKCEGKDVAKKRKCNEFEDTQIEETSETGQRERKKAKVLETHEEEVFGSKGRLTDSSRKDVAVHATSSSSKVSGSHKTKAKGSPVESVSSSPLRIVKSSDKLTSSRRNIEGVDNCQDVVSTKKDWEDDRGSYRSVGKGLGQLSSNNGKAKIIPPLESLNFCVGVDNEERRNDDQSHSNGSRSRKKGKGSSSRSKDKIRSSKSDIVKVNLKISDEEKSKGGRNKSQEKPCVKSNKLEKGSAPKKDEKQNGNGRDVSARGKLPPSGKGQNAGNALSVDAVEGIDASKVTKQRKKDENQNGNQSTSARHPTPNRHKDAPSPLRRESTSQAASAIKEAKALKHMADRLKNSGSNHESNSLYFQAALKFLYGSSLLESNYTESGKHGDMIQSMGMYSSTAKLCEYVAHEYEKSKEMAAAALAYKLAEVAYLKVVYSSHASASKDRQELQTSLQIGPTGESPSSSASDIDNLNNPAAIDKAALAKGVNDPQSGGNQVIAARNRPNFLRILNFAQDVNLAMEASRRSQIAFAASGSQPEHAHHKEVIKPALDFTFQDVEGLLQLVRVAMEVISR